jgi:hypothetical protein
LNVKRPLVHRETETQPAPVSLTGLPL